MEAPDRACPEMSAGRHAHSAGQQGANLFAAALWIGVVSILALASAACGSSSAPAAAHPGGTTETGANTQRTYALGEFPEFPDGSLPESTTVELQTVLGEAVEKVTFTGITAGVIIADRGSWTGAAGSRTILP